MALAKKAMSFEAVVIAVISLIVLVVLIPFYWAFKSGATTIVSDETCRQSIANTAKMISQLKSQLTGKQLKIECSTSYIDSGETDPSKAKEIISRQLYRCWDMYGRGEINFLQPGYKEKYCIVCARIKFNNRLRLDSIGEYLKEAYPNLFNSQNYNEAIDTSDPIAIIYYADSEITGLKTDTKGNVLGVTKDYHSELLIYNYNNIKDIGCTWMEGMEYLKVVEQAN